MEKAIVHVLALVSAATALAATTQVSDTQALVNLANGDGILPYTSVKLDGYPTEIGLPEIWLDATEWNDAEANWEFDPNDATKVTKIPSKTKNGRYLTISTSEGGHWSGFTVKSPVLVTGDAGTVPGCAIDFGSRGSKQAFVFNPDATGSNLLTSIGTVVAVMDTSDWGGYLLGGGFVAKREGYVWNRGNNIKKANDCVYDYTDPILHAVQPDPSFVKGYISQNGMFSGLTKTGFAGGWEVLSVTPLSATGCAYGLGLGDSRPAVYGNDSGGQRIAEMLVFTKVLTDEERQKAELYLNKKWFGTPTYGCDGAARLGTARASVNNGNQETGCASFEVTVPADERLTLDRVLGGRGTASPSLVKKGPGTLVLNGAEEYGGTVVLTNGTLAFERRTIPSDVPFGYCARFDASATDAITTDGDAVTRWRNEANVPTSILTNKVSATTTPVAAVPTDANRPTLIRNCFGTGKHAVDFGQYRNGSWLGLVDAYGTDVQFPNVHTVLAVVGVPNGGGYFLVGAQGQAANDTYNPFCRRPNLSAATPAWTAGIVRDGAVEAASYAVPARVYMNGRKYDPTSGYETPGWQVVALQTSGTKFGYIGNTGGNADYRGGMQIAELIVYYRPLSEREMLDAEAYLSNKWFKRVTPGYARASSAKTPDIRAVTVAGAATIDVPAGATVRIGTLDVRANLVKTGAGRLEAFEITKTRRARFNIAEGEVYIVDPPDPSETSEIAADASLHFDATDDAAFTLIPGETNLVAWADVNRHSAVYSYVNNARKYTPWREATGPDGKSVVNFGTQNKCLRFDRPHEGVRSAFAIVKYAEKGGTGGTIFGSYQTQYDSSNPQFMDFMHEGGQSMLLQKSVPSMVRNAEIRINGDLATGDTDLPTGWALVEFHPTAACHVSALGVDRGQDDGRAGGITLGEVLIYERELTTREKEATRNALMAKWFGTTPAQLSDKPESKAGKYVPNNPGGLILYLR